MDSSLSAHHSTLAASPGPRPQPPAPVLVAEGLTRRFGDGAAAVTAVDGVSLALGRGEIVLIMGPSGSGKSTLLMMLGALLRPSAGRIVVEGVDIARLSEAQLPSFRARRCGFIFQDFNLLSALTARENVEMALNLAGDKGAAARERAEALLRSLDLGHRLSHRPYQLSGGEKQRVAIARALANSPAVLLADEPTANLDSATGREVMRRLRQIAKEGGRSVIIVSHDQRLKEIADRVLWLEDGRFMQVTEMAVDPVCGMAVEREGAPTATRDGVAYVFCSAGCRAEFLGQLTPA